ncbi:ATP-dependent zinc protease family protein [Tahibacter amnicola]|uniref:ATP-dependent zinc protease family protein n=1 Tax=Tahibacter amnicola TaxID=2976241 RepID=UPI0031BA3654
MIGWREWVGLAGLGIVAVKAKVDTGARTSSLHVDSLERFRRGNQTWLRFQLRPGNRHGPSVVVAEAQATDRRRVTDSSGHATERWFILAAVRVGSLEFEAEINLTSRRNMLFPMLLGRTALAGRFQVDPRRSYLCSGTWGARGPELENEYRNPVA